MADRKISELSQLAGADVNAVDVAAVADISANETRKVTIKDLAEAGNRLLSPGSIPFDKIADIPDGYIEGDKLAGDSITADQIAPDSITSSELADQAVDTASLQDNAVTGPKLNASAFNRGLSKDVDDKVGITNSVTPGTQAGISFDEQGLITGTTSPIPSSDLPIATTAEAGAVSVPVDGGLSVNGAGAIRIANTIAAGTGYKITYTDHGLVTASDGIDPADLPIATDSTLGTVKVPNVDGAGDAAPISVDADGSLKHDQSTVTAGTYPKVVVDKYGHVTGGAALEATDIPELSYDQITSGTIGTGFLGNGVVTAENMADYSTSFMQDANPGQAPYLGMLWYSPETAQLNIYARGSNGLQWLPVGYGRLSAENLRWGGLVNADTGLVTVITDIGQSAGLQVGMAPLEATDALGGLYLVVDTSGSNIGVLPGTPFDSQDWLLCINEAQGWTKIDNAVGGGGGGGSTTLAGLLDTEITTPQDGELLVYNGGDGKWVNGGLAVIDGGTF